jgi:hypothetical protein
LKFEQGLLFVNHFARPDSDFATLSHRDAKKQKNFFYSGAGDVAAGSLVCSLAFDGAMLRGPSVGGGVCQ